MLNIKSSTATSSKYVPEAVDSDSKKLQLKKVNTASARTLQIPFINDSQKIEIDKIIGNLSIDDHNTAINFSEIDIAISKLTKTYLYYKNQNLPDKYKMNNYQYKIVKEYKDAKNYPSGIDRRPKKIFLPSFVGHGTNLESVLKAILNCNMQLVPSIKQIKLQGSMPTTGENRGITKLNQKYVSTVILQTLTSNYCALKRYAEMATSDKFFNFESNTYEQIENATFEFKIPVIVIGGGYSRMNVHSDIPNEVGCKRVNIRILAFKDSHDMVYAKNIIHRISKIKGDERVSKIIICTYDCLETSDTGYPDLEKLYKVY